ncbi:MAG TPA: hypothetical protein VEC16_02085 [Alphaproteobacteria bacterium]|nr:hypothetical protein [Alphaproteobacteria bacterium]
MAQANQKITQNTQAKQKQAKNKDSGSNQASNQKPQIIQRSSSLDVIYMEGKKILRSPVSEVLKKYKINGIIRFQEEDFRYIKPKSLLSHFNLQYAMGKRGKTYGLVLILDTGSYDGKTERLPVLDFNKMHRAICLRHRNNLTYNDLKPEDFKHSLKNIKSVNGLKKAMIRRYKKSMPGLSEEQIIALGISMTELQVL